MRLPDTPGMRAGHIDENIAIESLGQAGGKFKRLPKRQVGHMSQILILQYRRIERHIERRGNHRGAAKEFDAFIAAVDRRGQSPRGYRSVLAHVPFRPVAPAAPEPNAFAASKKAVSCAFTRWFTVPSG